MVLPPLVSILVAAAVALLSTGVVLHKKGVILPLFLARNNATAQSEKVLFVLTPAQRESLLRGVGLDDLNTTQDIRETFQREGYVIVRGLLDDEMLERLNAAGNVFMAQQAQVGPQTFSALKFGPVYLSAPSPDSSDETQQELSAFRQASMESAIPSFIATVLLELQPTTQTLRVLKDVFLAKGNETDYCGWHVDDQTFWPIQYIPENIQGVNAWIAMDDISARHGGGLAVSPSSHVAEWRHEAYQTIGSTPTYPEEGYEDVGKMFTSYKTTTCNLAEAAPNLASKIDDTRHVFDFQRGDVLIHTRWLFHRSVPLTKAGAKQFERLQQTPVIRRYSIRYEVGHAQLLQGFTMEPSVVLKRGNAGKTLDAISEEDSPWYPQCWPEVNQEEMAHLYEITEERLPEYEPLKQELFKQVLPYFRKS